MINETLYIKSRDVNLFTTIKGNEDSKNVIVILHGGPGSGAQPLIEHESFKKLEEDFIVVYFDQRGSGKSEYNLENKLLLEDITFDVHTIVEYAKNRFKDKDIFLWGGSFGGALGFLYLRYYPNEVKKYIANCPVVTFDDESIDTFVDNRKKYYIERLSEHIKPEFFEGFDSGEELFNDANVRKFIYSEKCTSKGLKHVCAMADWFLKLQYKEDFKNISIPVMIIQGKDDNICSYENILKGYNEFKNEYITFKAYENCGHSVFDDRKDIFVEDIKGFFI